MNYWCPVHEIYKRYVLRTAGIAKNGMRKQVTNNLDFGSLADSELANFINFLKRHQMIQHPYIDYERCKLYDIVRDTAGVDCIKIMDNEAARCVVHLLNEANSAVSRWTYRFQRAWANQPKHRNAYFRPSYLYNI